LIGSNLSLEFIRRPSDTWFVNKPFSPAIEVQLLDSDNCLQTQVNGLIIRASVTDGVNEVLSSTMSGGPVVGGSVEAVIQSGCAVFPNLRIMEVSSKHAKKFFHLVIDCKSNPSIRPAISQELRILSKNMDRKQPREDCMFDSLII